MKKSNMIAVLVVLFGLAPTAFAASDYLLQLDDVKGESISPVAGTAPAVQTTSSGDPDFDLLKQSPPPAPKPTPPPAGDPDFDLLRASGGTDENPLHKEDGLKGENPLYESTKVSPPAPKPNTDRDEDADGISKSDYRDDDDDADGIPTIDEDMDLSVSVDKVTVRGWDPKKKEEFMSERKEAAEVHSQQELEHFAQGVLLDDEKIVDVQFNPKELSVSYEAEGKLLWFIPVSFTERLVASGEDGSEVVFATKKPWWGFLVSADDDGEDAALSAKKKHKETMQIESWSFGASNQASILQTISNVLKTKHDTAKNSVGNIR